MTKKDLARVVSNRTGMPQKQTHEVVQSILGTVLETLAAEGRIELRNFGLFEVKQRAARKARNPRTGEKVDVPEKYVVTFKPGRAMQQRVENGSPRVD
jgi:nucleoid DNA-binding protein